MLPQISKSLCPQAWYPVLLISAVLNAQNPLKLGDNVSLRECLMREMRLNKSFESDDYEVYDEQIKQLSFWNRHFEHGPLGDVASADDSLRAPDDTKKRKHSLSASASGLLDLASGSASGASDLASGSGSVAAGASGAARGSAAKEGSF